MAALHGWFARRGAVGSTANARTSSAPTRRIPVWLQENLEHSLPFLVAGAACMGIGLWVRATEAHAGGHLELWLLLVGIGLAVIGGGVALTLVAEEPTGLVPPLDDRYVIVDKVDWERLQGSSPPGDLATPEPALPEYIEGEPEGTPPAPTGPAPWIEEEPGSVSPESVPTGGGSPVTKPGTADYGSPAALPQGTAGERPSPGPEESRPWAEDTDVPAPPKPSPAVSASTLGPHATGAPVSRPPASPSSGIPVSGAGAPPARVVGAPATPPPTLNPAEERFEELVSELNAIAGASPSAPAAPMRTLTSTLARSQNLCTTCARRLEEGGGLICVSCETPLCTNCHDESLRKRGIALCSECARVFDRPEVWLSTRPEE